MAHGDHVKYGETVSRMRTKLQEKWYTQIRKWKITNIIKNFALKKTT